MSYNYHNSEEVFVRRLVLLGLHEQALIVMGASELFLVQRGSIVEALYRSLDRRHSLLYVHWDSNE